MRAHRPMSTALCLIALIGVGACSSPTVDRLMGFPHTWIGRNTADAFMIQIAKNGDTISGTIDDASLDEADVTHVKAVHASFTGVIDGSAVTLTIPQGLGFTTNISGSLASDRMTLQLPQDNGQLVAVTLTPGSVDDYNRLAGGVRASASANDSAQAAADTAAAAAQADQERRDKIDKAADTVASDIADLRGAAQTPDYADFDDAIKQAKSDLAHAKSDAARAAAEPDRGDACSDAGDVQSDAGDVESDSGDVETATSSLEAAIGAAKDAVAQLNQDLEAYREAAAAVPGYSPPNAPDMGAIQSLLTDVSKRTAAWTAKGKQYQTQAAGLLNQANSVADHAEKAYC